MPSGFFEPSIPSLYPVSAVLYTVCDVPYTSKDRRSADSAPLLRGAESQSARAKAVRTTLDDSQRPQRGYSGQQLVIAYQREYSIPPLMPAVCYRGASPVLCSARSGIAP